MDCSADTQAGHEHKQHREQLYANKNGNVYETDELLKK